jgi:GNAT superfamily N-acetyltransferase
MVRRLLAADRESALATVVAAFVADPLVRWWFPDDATYADLAGRFFGVLLDTRLEGGEVWVVDAAGCVGAVSMWVPPGGNLLGPDVVAGRYGDVVSALPAQSAERIGTADEVIDALLPRSPHWYLGVLACHPGHRGAGLGTAVCEPVFAAADRAGVPIVLETATAANVGYYTRRGFSVFQQAALDQAGAPLTVRVMLREPRDDCRA